MPGERFALKAREMLAAYIQSDLPTHLAAVEVALGLTAGIIGRPSVVLRGEDVNDPRDNKVEVYVPQGGPKNVLSRDLFDYELEVAITLFSPDADPISAEERLMRWESAWWLLMGKGGTNCNRTVVGAVCENFAMDKTRGPKGSQIAIAVAPVRVTIQEG